MGKLIAPSEAVLPCPAPAPPRAWRALWAAGVVCECSSGALGTDAPYHDLPGRVVEPRAGVQICAPLSPVFIFNRALPWFWPSRKEGWA